MQLNSLVFAAPKCSYSTQSLFKEIIYVPRCRETWNCDDSASAGSNETATTDSKIYDIPPNEVSVCLQGRREFGNDGHQFTQTFAEDTDSQLCNVDEGKQIGSIPCLFLDRLMNKEERDKKWDSNKIDIDEVENKNSDPTHASYEA